MKHKLFDTIEFEVEHPLYLARIQQMPTGSTQRVRINEFEAKTVPVFAVVILYLPKYGRVTFDGRPFDGMDGAYRVLYETRIVVGLGTSQDDLTELTDQATSLAEANPDPALWHEEN